VVETRATRQVYANPWMTVREDAIRHPDGRDGIYGVVDKPDYALVVARDDSPEQWLAMVEQYRYPLGLRRWEFPQGTAPDRAEMPARDLAARELREETGLSAATWTYLGLLDVAPGVSSQRGRAYLATDLTAGDPEREDTEADMRFAWVTRAEFEDRARAGEITDAQTLAAYALLLLRSP
jgi:8-oxo-dGTP pyrophosphatase MutT (NUDIX family)